MQTLFVAAGITFGGYQDSGLSEIGGNPHLLKLQHMRWRYIASWFRC
jgi:hypothetical protein